MDIIVNFTATNAITVKDIDFDPDLFDLYGDYANDLLRAFYELNKNDIRIKNASLALKKDNKIYTTLHPITV
jgi:hypothetical protein